MTTTASNLSGVALLKDVGKRSTDPLANVDTGPLLAILCESFGAVAQPGERHAGSVEVTGSIPVGSTTGHGSSLIQTSLAQSFETPEGCCFIVHLHA